MGVEKLENSLNRGAHIIIARFSITYEYIRETMMRGWSKSILGRKLREINTALVEHLEIPAEESSKPHHDSAELAARVAEADTIREQGQRLALILECEAVGSQPLEKQREETLEEPRASITTARKKRTGSYVRPLTPSPVCGRAA